MNIESIKELALEAGKAIMGIYENETRIKIDYKQDSSPLTMADRASHDIIEKGLLSLPYGFPVISEEGKQHSYAERVSLKKYWLVDPLDGTKEFIKRNGEFTVNIALIEDSMPVLGVVYAPVLDQLYWAEKGEGAYVKDGDKCNLLKVNQFHPEDKNLRIVCSRSHLNDKTSSFIEDYTSPILVACGSSLKFLKIANGEAEIYPRLAPTMEWDTAAAQIILEEAGGSVLQYSNLKKVVYNKKELINPHFIAQAKIKKVRN